MPSTKVSHKIGIRGGAIGGDAHVGQRERHVPHGWSDLPDPVLDFDRRAELFLLNMLCLFLCQRAHRRSQSAGVEHLATAGPADTRRFAWRDCANKL